MAFQIHCPRCQTAMTVTGGEIGTQCACPQCGENFTVPMPGPRPVGASPAAAPASPNSVHAVRPKRKVKIQITSILAGLFLLFMLFPIVGRSRKTLFQAFLDSQRPAKGVSVQDPTRMKLNVGAVCVQDHAVNTIYHHKITDGQVPPTLFKEYVAELEKIDMTRCPSDFQEARAQVIAAWRRYGQNMASSSGGTGSEANARSMLQGMFRAVQEVGSTLEAYAAVLQRYDQSIDQDPLWRSSKFRP